MSAIYFEGKPQAAKKFYFLGYFYVLLKSVQGSSREEKIFDQFLSLKQQHQLGESKYKKLTVDTDTSHNRMVRYRYTFEQVVSEAIDYELIDKNNDLFFLTDWGKEAIEIYGKEGYVAFNHFLFRFMENKYQAFRYLVEACYKTNPGKSGLLIFPTYSAYRIGIERDEIQTTGDLIEYFSTLKSRLEEDIYKYLGDRKDPSAKNDELIHTLIEAGLLAKDTSIPFNPSKYNVILKRGRDFWLKYFLQDLYNHQYSLNNFEIWAYRAKQIGILHITEFYPDPNFIGRIVYPLSVIKHSSSAANFHKLFTYSDGKHLLLHQPSWSDEENQEEFVQNLHHAYVDVRQSAKTYFVSLSSVRERVCYSMKIPEYLFDEFLGNAYREKLKIRISLEVDKLPEETKLMYLRREPVMVDNKYRNIIAIDLV